MKRFFVSIFLIWLINAGSGEFVYSQGLLKKVGDRMGKEAERMLDKNGNNKNDNDSNQQNVSEPMDSGQPSMSGYEAQTRTSSTGRKKMTPPDVKKSIEDAENTFQAKDYDDARFNMQQALVGIELEVGYQILNSMPKEISGLKFDEEYDQVVTGGYGWVGFNVARSYFGNQDKSLDVNVHNNAAMLSSVNMVLTNPMYMNSSDGNQKAVKVGEYKALLEAEEDGGFRLSIPLGQSSVILYEFDNFPDENEVVASAQQLNIEEIKTMLGEQ